MPPPQVHFLSCRCQSLLRGQVLGAGVHEGAGVRRCRELFCGRGEEGEHACFDAGEMLREGPRIFDAVFELRESLGELRMQLFESLYGGAKVGA
jgi:hypothetical protein